MKFLSYEETGLAINMQNESGRYIIYKMKNKGRIEINPDVVAEKLAI